MCSLFKEQGGRKEREETTEKPTSLIVARIQNSKSRTLTASHKRTWPKQTKPTLQNQMQKNKKCKETKRNYPKL